MKYLQRKRFFHLERLCSSPSNVGFKIFSSFPNDIINCNTAALSKAMAGYPLKKFFIFFL
uniref:Uncharacterized protein n=1 Tax=Arundo donax TaxID=35708 RepID=A0A0A9APN6_ARUDO